MSKIDNTKKKGASAFFAQVPAKIFWSILVLVFVLFGALSLAITEEPTDAQKVRSITKQLRCLECEGLSINDSETQTSKSIAKDVQRRVKEGESESEILDYYVEIYGEYVLLAPTTEGGNWLIYVLPAFFVVVFVAATILSIRKKQSSKVQLVFWIAAGLILVAGIIVFVNDTKSSEVQTIERNSQTTEELLQQAVDESANNENLRSLAIVQFAQEDFVNALQNFDKAAALDPGDGESRGYAAYIVFLTGQYDLARSRADQAIEADNQNAAALFFRGLIYFETPQDDPAIKQANQDLANKDFDEVLRIAPESDFARQIQEVRASI